MQRESRRRGYGALLAVAVLVLVACSYITSRERDSVSPLEYAIREALAPVQTALFRVASELNSFGRTVANLGQLIRENDQLYLEMSRLMAENARLEEYRLENIRLRRLLGFQETMSHATIAAEIIARDPGNWLGTVTINRGTRHGVAKNMAVVTAEGLVGRVLSATWNTANVLLVVDPRSAVGGMAQRTRTLVLVEGDPGTAGMCQVKFLVPDPDVAEGDTLLSSGLGGIYPKGLVIGEIVEVVPGKYGVGRAARLRPAVDFARLEEVLIIVGGEGAGAKGDHPQQGTYGP